MRNGATTQLVVYQQTVQAEQDSLTLTTRASSAREEQERMATAAEIVLLSATRDDLQQELQLQLQQFAAFKIKAHESLGYVQTQGEVLRQAHGVAVMQLSATAATGVHSCNCKLYIHVCINLSICKYISLYICLNLYIHTYSEISIRNMVLELLAICICVRACTRPVESSTVLHRSSYCAVHMYVCVCL